MKTEESVKAEEIDGYRGGDDLDSLLQFIEDKPKSKPSGNPGSGNNPAPQQTGSGSGNSSKSKRSRRTDHKSKRLEILNGELKNNKKNFLIKSGIFHFLIEMPSILE